LFVNQPVEEIEKDPHVDASFLGEKQVEQAADLMKAVIASSAFPMAYEPVEIRGRLCSDGGLVAKQPVIPAIRLGADAIFLVTVDAADEKVGAIKTFMDVGMRAFDILMSRNVQADLAYLHNVNRICETCAADVGALPEQIQLEIANRTYRFVKTFTVRPARRLSAALLDFDGAVTRPAISQGYMDGTQAVRDFIDYATKAPVVETRKIVRLRAEELRGAKVGR
jgi:predicted acylesterase/phospholipase RssA